MKIIIAMSVSFTKAQVLLETIIVIMKDASEFSAIKPGKLYCDKNLNI